VFITDRFSNMQSPSKSSPKKTTKQQPQIPGQSNIDGYLRVSRPVIARNDVDDINSASKADASFSPLLRRRRICDDDDDEPVVNNQPPPTNTNNPVLIQDTENESDANFAVILRPQREPLHDQSAHGTKSRRTQSRRTQTPEPAELADTAQPV